MKNLHFTSYLIVAALFCLMRASTASAQQATSLAELDALKRRIDAVISENQTLSQRVRELEESEEEREKAEKQGAKPGEEGGEEGAKNGNGNGAGKNGGEEGGEEGGAEKEKDPGQLNEWIKFGGAIEVNAFAGRDFDDIGESDIVLDTAEIDFELQLSKCVTGVLVIEYDDGEDVLIPIGDDGDEDELAIDRFRVDEAYFLIGRGPKTGIPGRGGELANTEIKSPFFLKGGRAIAPFGISTGDPVADVLTISDPLTIEAFETKEDLFMFGFETGTFNSAIYVFNGETNPDGGPDLIQHFGATAGYRVKGYAWSFDFDVDFINSVFDTGKGRFDGLTGAFPEALEGEFIPGLAAHIKSNFGPISFVVEYNGALDKAVIEIDGDDVALAPRAWQTQLAYQFGYRPDMEEFGTENSYVAVGYSEGEDMAGVFPQKRLLVSYGKWFFDEFRWAVEYAHDVDYSEDDFGTGNKANIFTTQVTYEW